MFEFFEGMIEKLGVKLVGDFTSKLIDFIQNVMKNKDEENSDNGTDSAQIGSSGDSARIGSSGDSAQIGSSGDYARIGSSGYSAQIGSSGDYAQIGSSGDSARIGSSGDSAQIGSSGDYARIGSSGYSAQIGSSGDYAQIGSSGDSARIGSSGDSAQIGSSGDYARIGSSGDSARIGSSGDSAQIGSSGDYAQIGSSGDSAQIDISGKNSIGFACGYKSFIKAKKGTWISLAEWKRDEDGNYIPVFAKSAQVGNKEYKDFSGKMLKENTYYILWQREFYPVIKLDGIWTIKLSEKKRDNITIIKAIDIDNIYVNDVDKIEEIYIAQENELSAHGYTLREAVDDLTLKKLDNINTDEIVAEIKKTGKVTRSQYRAITGACSFGTNKFCEQHNIQDLEEISLDELRKILVDDYGAKRFWKLIDED